MAAAETTSAAEASNEAAPEWTGKAEAGMKAGLSGDASQKARAQAVKAAAAEAQTKAAQAQPAGAAHAQAQVEAVLGEEAHVEFAKLQAEVEEATAMRNKDSADPLCDGADHFS